MLRNRSEYTVDRRLEDQAQKQKDELGGHSYTFQLGNMAAGTRRAVKGVSRGRGLMGNVQVREDGRCRRDRCRHDRKKAGVTGRF